MDKKRNVFWCVLGGLLLCGLMPPAAPAETPREIAKRVLPSVVLLVMEDANGEKIATASGFVIKEGIIVTNIHAIEGASGAYAKLSGKESKHKIRGVVASDTERDLVLLAVDGLNAAPLLVGDSNNVAVGDTVYAVGSPKGLAGTFSPGMVSAIRKAGGDSLLQITAPVSHGSSGGPVVNTKGEVVGVVVSTLKSGQNLNFVIPANYLTPLLAKKGQAKPIGNTAPKKGTSGHTSDYWKKMAESQRKAAEKGDADAMFNMGVMYHNGQGVQQDYREAMHWFRKAADKGVAEAMFGVGAIYHNGRGVLQDSRQAMNWFRKAGKRGHPGAMFNLASMYHQGLCTPQDYRKAMRWFRKAADKGNVDAMVNLALMYNKGEGVPQNCYPQAKRWFRKAAERGNTKAMCNMAVMYWKGQGVPQDYRKAYAWSSVATAFGDKNAIELREAFARVLTASSKRIAQAQANRLFKRIQNNMNK